MNKIVVYTCIFGNYDCLKPVVNPSSSIDYICFTDNPNLESDGVWKIRQFVSDIYTENLSPIKKQRMIKILPHIYLKEYDISLWVDGNIQITGNLIFEFFNNLDDEKIMYVNRHLARDCIYREEVEVIRLKKDKPENTNKQIARYRAEGFPEHFGLAETNIIVRRHNDFRCKKLMFDWAKEIVNGSYRDQLSFDYCRWKNGMSDYIGWLECNKYYTTSYDVFRIYHHGQKMRPIFILNKQNKFKIVPNKTEQEQKPQTEAIDNKEDKKVEDNKENKIAEDNAKEKLKNEVEKIKEENNNISNSLKEKLKVIEALKQKLEIANYKNTKLENINTVNAEEIKELNSSINVYEVKINKLNATLEGFKKLVENHKMQDSSTKKIIQNLENTKKELEKKLQLELDKQQKIKEEKYKGEINFKNELNKNYDSEKINLEDSTVIVSVASYKNRLQSDTLLLTLDSILKQNTKYKYKIIVNIPKTHASYISNDLYKFFKDNNIELFLCDLDLKSHNKYFWTMKRYKKYPIILIDDDLIYDDDLIESLMSNYQINKNIVYARRTHFMKFDNDGNILPYKKWLYEYKYELKPSNNLFLTSGGGTLFPPNILNISDLDIDKIYSCLYADDIFINNILFKARIPIKYVHGNRPIAYRQQREATSESSLYNINVNKDFNTIYIEKLYNMDFKHCVNLIFLIDNNYTNQLFVCLRSIKENKSEKTIISANILVTDYNIDLIEKLNKFQSHGFYINVVKIDEALLKKCEEYNRKTTELKKNSASSTALIKFELPNIFFYLKRALYLDTDIIVNKDIRQIYNQNLEGNYIGAIPDIGKITLKNRDKSTLLPERLTSEYINSGVILMDLEKIRNDWLVDELWKAKLNLTDQQLTDQNAINVVFKNKIKYLPMKFNCLISSIYGIVARGQLNELNENYNTNYKSINDIEKDAVIFHLAGRLKPWNSSVKNFAFNLYHYYESCN